jgi:hypothetical protein
MEDVEGRSRLASVLDVCEHEMQALDRLRDTRLSGVLQAMTNVARGDRRGYGSAHARRE